MTAIFLGEWTGRLPLIALGQGSPAPIPMLNSTQLPNQKLKNKTPKSELADNPTFRTARNEKFK
jgi:hypothetical protein